MSTPQRYRLPRKVVLRGRETFRALFAEGKGKRAGNILLKYRTVPAPGQQNVMTGFVVSKKHGNAVFRNRVRRLMREAWRHERPEFVRQLPEDTELHMVLIWTGNSSAGKRPPELRAIHNDLTKVLPRIVTSLSGEHASHSPSS